MVRSKIVSNIDLRQYITNAEVRNNNINLDNIPKEYFQSMLKRKDEQIRARDLDFVQSLNFQEICGKHVDEKMHLILMISKILLRLRYKNGGRLVMLNYSVEQLQTFEQFIKKIKADIDLN